MLQGPIRIIWSFMCVHCFDRSWNIYGFILLKRTKEKYVHRNFSAFKYSAQFGSLYLFEFWTDWIFLWSQLVKDHTRQQKWAGIWQIFEQTNLNGPKSVGNFSLISRNSVCCHSNYLKNFFFIFLPLAFSRASARWVKFNKDSYHFSNRVTFAKYASNPFLSS